MSGRTPRPRSGALPAAVPAALPVIVLVTLLVAVLGGCGSPSAGPAPAPAPTTVTVTVTSSGPAPSASVTPSGSTTTPSSGTSTAVVPALRSGYLPLYPFATGQQVLAWQEAYRADGSGPWHRSAERTALEFARSYLGYSEVDRTTSHTGTAGDVRVGVGWADPFGRDVTAGVVHLLRFGTGADAPWEVVGTKDSVLSLTAPRYGSTVAGTFTVGGRITGVDESLVVEARALPSGDVLAAPAPLPAGGEDTPWRTRITVDAPAGTVVTVSVSTGGHLMGVEAFAVTGVRIG